MTIKPVNLGPVSPYVDPIGDAIKKFAQVGVGAPNIQWVYWSDPAGTGRWEFQCSAYYLQTAEDAELLYTLSCFGGCAFGSVGGAPPAPTPTWPTGANVQQLHGPLFNSGIVSPSGRILGTNAQTRVLTLSATDPTKLLADMQQALKPYNSSLNFIYYDDTANSGIWRVQGTSYYLLNLPQLIYSTVVQSGGNSRGGGGVPATPPPSWMGAGGSQGGGLPSGVIPVQVFNLFPFL